MKNDTKAKTAVVIGAVLSFPVVRALQDGSISASTAAIRVAIAMVLAYGGLSLVLAVLDLYAPKPEPETPEQAVDDGVEDAVLVDDEQPLPPEG